MEWVVRDIAAVNSIIYYLDDFLCVGLASSEVCAVLLTTLEYIAECFGIPLAPDKTEGPTTVISFLGIVVDSEAMECQLPEEKLRALQAEIRAIVGLCKVQLRTLQSVLGKLNFACRIIPMGRVFSRRLSASTGGVESPKHFVRLNKDHRDDLRIWHGCCGIHRFRGFLPGEVECGAVARILESGGASEEHGATGAISGGTGGEAMGPNPSGKARFHGDNLGVVQVINKVSSASPPVVRLLRHLVLRCMQLNVFIYAVHLPGVENVTADALPRFQWGKFRELAPAADTHGVPCPPGLWKIALEWSLTGSDGQ